MTNRYSKWSRHSKRMVCLLAACSLMYACKDDYLLDDEKPSWLNTSILKSLEQRGNFTYYLRLLEDKELNGEVEGSEAASMKEVLDRTGSKTLFVANDEGWEKFFAKNDSLAANNPWKNATSYEKLTLAQKKLLLHSSMLNNAIVSENLSNSTSSGNNPPVQGEYMRRNTDYEPTDTIAYIPADQVMSTSSIIDKDYWKRFREDGRGIFLSTDNTESMMLLFTNEHMKKTGITDDDFRVLMGEPRTEVEDVYVYDSKVIERDIICENGYVNVMEKPLAPLANMAEIIRTSGKTNIFSHILDRFSAPFFNPTLTRAYKDLHDDAPDSIFVKRYFSENSIGVNPWAKEPYGDESDYNKLPSYFPYKTLEQIKAEAGQELDEDLIKDIEKMLAAKSMPILKFDPGWNAYIASDYKTNQERGLHNDMAAMFVPSDVALRDYFREGGGKQFILVFGKPNEPGYNNWLHSDEDLIKNIDLIPLDRISQFVNLIMMRSFTGSVPSKMTKLRDDALEQLFTSEDRNEIDTCILGCNGAVYIMGKTYGPADFTSVTSPAVISRTNNIMNWAIYNGSKSTEKDFMKLNYYAYLKAMQSKFTFLLPSDSAMAYYYDPMSFKSTNPRMIAFNYRTGNFDPQKTMPVDNTVYKYGTVNKLDKVKPWINDGKIGSKISSDIDDNDVVNRLKDILESHTIVHDGTNDIYGVDEYFLSKNGNAIKMIRDENDSIVAVMGALQIENQLQMEESATPMEMHPGIKQCDIDLAFPNCKNGHTYVIKAPMIPTYRSVYSILTNDGAITMDADERDNCPYTAFYDLVDCSKKDVTDAAVACGLIDGKAYKENAKRQQQAKKYLAFDNSKKELDFNITFFNNYHYTAFIPDSTAIQEARANGLPSWKEILADYEAHKAIKVAYDTLVWDGIDPETGDTLWVYDDERLATAADSARLQAKITYLTNFVRYHFADNTIFADHSAVPEEGRGEMVTSCYDNKTGLFVKIHAHREETGRYDEPVLVVRDHAAYLHDTRLDEYMKTYNPEHPTQDNYTGENEQGLKVLTDKFNGVKNIKNVLARDITCNGDPTTTMRGKQMTSASTAVIHMIPGVLHHVNLENGRHDSMWETPSAARKYVKRYAVPEL